VEAFIRLFIWGAVVKSPSSGTGFVLELYVLQSVRKSFQPVWPDLATPLNHTAT